MSLPKRNGLIRVVYGLSMIGMFVFLGNEAVSYASGPPAPAEAKAVKPREPSAARQTMATNTLPIKQGTPLKVQGVSTVLNLDSDVDAQINQHWLTFAQSELANSLPQSREVYAVYSDYDNKHNSVNLTLGFVIQDPVAGTVTATINTGLYLPVSGKTVLESWQKPDLSAQSLRYETDYERWILDKNYQPVRVTAHLGLR